MGIRLFQWDRIRCRHGAHNDLQTSLLLPLSPGEYIPGNSCGYIVGSMTERAPSFSPKSMDHLPDITTAEQRSLSKWYTVARAALARNRPLTADSPKDRRSTN